MPRGSDAAALRNELAAQYGPYASAEDLILAHNATLDPTLDRVLQVPLDEEATDEVKANLEAHEAKFDLGEGEYLLDASVRGNALVGLVIEADGRHRKQVVAWNDNYKAPRLTAAEQRRREQALAQGEVVKETARVRQEAEERVRQAKEEADAYARERIAEIQAETEARVKEAEEGASKPAEEKPAAKPKAKATAKKSSGKASSKSK